ncbi:MAG: DUF2244 domain-containing protein [Pseudomonadota bacterium]
MMKGSLAAPTAVLDVVLYPNCSLGQTGFAALMAAIVVVSVAVGAGFMMVGAWPVTGFLGLDVLLVYLALRWNRREARRAEYVRLDGAALKVRRLEPNGRSQDWSFEPYWVRVVLESMGPYDNRLSLRSHGRELVIGAFLTSAERREVADVLNQALDQQRAAAG